MTAHFERLPRVAMLCVTAAAAVTLLSGCTATTSNRVQTKAQYQEFTDVTWLPEHSVRAPYHSPEISKSTADSLREGIYAFYSTHQSRFSLEKRNDGTYVAQEVVGRPGYRVLTWGTGANVLYRNARAQENTGTVKATDMQDGRLLLENVGKAPFNMAVKLRAFNVSGKPVRHFLRNANNQPDALAWYIPNHVVFPQGSVAYIATYWLGDDEILRPSQSTFTGASNLERLLTQFSQNIPYCLSYVNHQKANPYGIIFDRPAKSSRSKKKSSPTSGTFHLVSADRSSMFCAADASNPKQPTGTWKISTIHGTRVIELHPQSDVAHSDLGIQPVNKDATDVGFAEVMQPSARGERMSVVPVRILRNNQPITDFRLKFNRQAAETLATVLQTAADTKAAYEANQKNQAQEL